MPHVTHVILRRVKVAPVCGFHCWQGPSQLPCTVLRTSTLGNVNETPLPPGDRIPTLFHPLPPSLRLSLTDVPPWRALVVMHVWI
jgi:hypothetical protein